MEFGTKRTISDFCLFIWFCFILSGRPWAKGRVLTRDLARWLPSCSVLADSGMWPVACSLHWPCLPSPALPAPTSIACPLRPHLPPLASHAPIGLACPHWPRLPPSASPAPISLACPHQPRLPPSASPAPMARRRALHWYSALGSGFGSRHCVFPSLSFIYKSIVVLLFGSTDNSSSSRLNTDSEFRVGLSPIVLQVWVLSLVLVRAAV